MPNIETGKYWDEGKIIISGCTPCSSGCLNCWSSHSPRIAQTQPVKDGHFTGEVKFRADRLRELCKGKKKHIAIWNDFLHEGIRLDEIRSLIDCCPHSNNIILGLTKRAARLKEIAVFNLPSNFWLGVTCCNQKEADKNLPLLIDTQARIKYVSYEPLLSEIDTEYAAGTEVVWTGLIDWLVIGAETGPYRRPCKLEWIECAVEQFHDAGLPVWVKAVNINGKIIHKFDELPESVRYRELPERETQDEQCD